MTSEHRRPDFVVIGAMKAGTTTLFRWLNAHPGCRLSPVKEPHFFSRDERFEEGPWTYLELFRDVPSELVTGEASASYADARIARKVANRMGDLIPDAKVIYLVRDPVARLRSHYLHEWQRSRERRPLLEALADPANPYLAFSRYEDAFAPFRAVYGNSRALVVDTSSFTDASSAGWDRVTEFLRLTPQPGAEERANVSSEKMAFNPPLLRLWESGLLERARVLPRPVRRAGRLIAAPATRRLRREASAVQKTALPLDLVDELNHQWHTILETTG